MYAIIQIRTKVFVGKGWKFYVGSPVLKLAPLQTISLAVWLTMMAPNEANGQGPLWSYNAWLVWTGLVMGIHRFEGDRTNETHVLDASRIWNAVDD
jgi:hypothetical protein